MKLCLIVYASIVLLAACGRSSPPDTVASLTADPGRLKKVMRQCKEERAKVGDTTCYTASEAWRKRFMGNGQPKYTPKD